MEFDEEYEICEEALNGLVGSTAGSGQPSSSQIYHRNGLAGSGLPSSSQTQSQPSGYFGTSQLNKLTIDGDIVDVKGLSNGLCLLESFTNEEIQGCLFSTSFTASSCSQETYLVLDTIDNKTSNFVIFIHFNVIWVGLAVM
ncbi:hypothetical protein P8452_46193 [Trifolium repens]|nr:hypothetical protein P8452_46193 [Trifolium repens]